MSKQAQVTAEKKSRPSASRYEITFEPAPERVRIEFNGVVVADSEHAMILRESRLAPVYYFPREDTRADLMHRTRHTTYCPFRGNASYWTLTVGEQVAEDAVWSYLDPFEESVRVKDYFAFYQQRMDAVTVGGKEITHDTLRSSAHANPLANWLLTEALEAASARDLVQKFANAMLHAGIPIGRLWLTVRTLHPQLLSNGYTWQANGEGVEEYEVPYETINEARFLDSPLRAIFDGAGGLRRKLDVPNPNLDYPIVHELHAEGATDYVVMPFMFSDGQINAISLTSHQPGGFTTETLGNVYEVLPLLSRVFEVHALRSNAVNLLSTYLGRQAGKKVLNGHIRRGDGENVHAVIWFCDLRGSTPLADELPREQFLELLNRYFECMAGAVLDHGGEVLRFIGDAALAIFPIKEAEEKDPKLTVEACKTALAAANDARLRMNTLNTGRAEAGEDPLGYGIGLHVGDVMYGNIGTEQRLEFTVIGPAANEAARIEALCKTLGEPLLVSEEFARHFPDQLESLGNHSLRGVSTPQEIFTLRQ